MILPSEISNEGMVLIMDKIHTYVTTVPTPIELECPKSDEPTTMIKDDFHNILKGGDQLTVARARSSKRIRSNSLHSLDRLESLIPVFEDWHAKGCLISVSLHAHVTITRTNSWTNFFCTGHVEAILQYYIRKGWRYIISIAELDQ